MPHSAACRCPRQENPNIGGNLQKIQDEREDLEKLLRTTLSELRDGSYATLAQQVEDDKREQENLERIIQREKEASEAVRQLSDGARAAACKEDGTRWGAMLALTLTAPRFPRAGDGAARARARAGRAQEAHRGAEGAAVRAARQDERACQV